MAGHGLFIIANEYSIMNECEILQLCNALSDWLEMLTRLYRLKWTDRQSNELK